MQYNEAQGSPSQGWNLEDGYPKNASLETFPRRALGNGAKSGLFILLRAYQPDCDYLCRGPVQGFKVLLHNPAEIPRIGQQYFRAPLNQEVVVVVKPSMMTTSNGLREYDPSRRQCYFPSERHLLYFKVSGRNAPTLQAAAGRPTIGGDIPLVTGRTRRGVEPSPQRGIARSCVATPRFPE